ncbi:MAG: nitroreductase family protein [Chloroflexota bacterium]
MDVWEAIEKRRTTRAFRGVVPKELLRKIIRAGSRAPSGRNTQPWEFIIVNDPGIIDQIAEQKYQQNRKIGTEEAAARQRNVYRDSSVVAVCCQRGGMSPIAGWLATQNMALAATAEGLAGVTSTLRDEQKATAEKLLGLPADYELVTMMVIGVPVSIPREREEGVERPDFSWLHVNRFGNAS